MVFNISWEQRKVGQSGFLRGRIGFRGYTRDDLVSPHEGAVTFSPSDINESGHVDLEHNDYISFDKYEENQYCKIVDFDLFRVSKKMDNQYGW